MGTFSEEIEFLDVLRILMLQLQGNIHINVKHRRRRNVTSPSRAMTLSEGDLNIFATTLPWRLPEALRSE